MVIYGEQCKKDSDCNSNICQYSGAFNERKCVIQEPDPLAGIRCGNSFAFREHSNWERKQNS